MNQAHRAGPAAPIHYTARMFDLLPLLGSRVPQIRIVDVGALWLGADDLAYRALMLEGLSTVVGFEPIQSECDKLNAMRISGHTYLPYFIGDGEERDFYLTTSKLTSSLYEPNTPLLNRFHLLTEQMTVESTTRVKTRRLDDIPEIKSIDFAKIDVQGAELDVIKGGRRLLADACVVEAEVEFVHLYKNQPLFGDVDAEMRSLGYVLHMFQSLNGRYFTPVVDPRTPQGCLHQHLWGNAVWVRDFTRFAERTPRELVVIAIIMHMVYQSFDLAALAFQHLDRLTGDTMWQQYMTCLTGEQAPPAPPIL